MIFVELTSKIIIWAYIITIIPAIFFTYQQEKAGMKIQDAPNRLIGIIYHFFTVWIIIPFFFYHFFKNNRK